MSGKDRVAIHSAAGYEIQRVQRGDDGVIQAAGKMRDQAAEVHDVTDLAVDIGNSAGRRIDIQRRPDGLKSGRGAVENGQQVGCLQVVEVRQLVIAGIRRHGGRRRDPIGQPTGFHL